MTQNRRAGNARSVRQQHELSFEHRRIAVQRVSQFVSCALQLLLVSCAQTNEVASELEIADSAGLAISTITVAPTALADWRLLPKPALVLTGVESGDSSAFAHVGGVRWLTDGRIVVADLAANRLLIFDSAGKYVRSLGRQGSGPGEFRRITSVTVLRGDSLATFDGGLRRLSLWHADAGYLRSVVVGGSSLESWPADAWIWRDSLVVVLQLSITPLDSVPPGSGVRRWPMRAHLTMHDTAGRRLATSPEFAGMYSGLIPDGDMRLPFSNQPFTAATSDRTYFGSGQSFALRYLTSSFKWAGEIRWPRIEEDLTSSEINQIRTEAEALAATRLSAAQAHQRLAPAFAPEVLPRKRPAIGRVLVAPDQNLWVERFEPLRLGTSVQKAGDRWTIVTPTGNPIARLVLPTGSRLEAIRGERVIIVMHDTLDIQTVEVRELKKR